MRLFLPLALILILTGGALPLAQAAPPAAVAAPVLKWQYGGCQPAPHYCDTGWYASPAVADLDGDGKPEVLWGSYDLLALNGEDGSTQWGAQSGQRIWPGVVVADLDANGSLEVVVGRGGDQVTAYTSSGAVAWARNPFGRGEVRSLAAEDLEGDGRLEVIVGRAGTGDIEQVNVFDAAGAQRPGWPARRASDSTIGYGSGMYNENLAIADLGGSSDKEIYAPTDTHYITALRPDGTQVAASSIYGPGKVWSQVGVHVDHTVDLRGYAYCGTEHRPNFANVAPAAGDLDGDGMLELVVPGDVYNCDTGDPDGDMYYLPWILRGDRTRWKNASYDWEALPTPEPGSGPLSQDYSVIENIAVNTVLADLDGDGVSEILFPSYDGRLHAYWLDKTQHGSWPFDVPGAGIRFASEPAVVDLDNDGRAEVLFTSWPESQGGQVGQLHILSDQGVQLYAVNLPAPGAGADWNGGLGAPTVANLDADADLE
ncbi:MAG: VCBS repeat-containing protein, partial [Chloroflexales bacterium]|nr:VCBS repeat-containing protein [Chloroflexales bacterium]